MFGGGANVGSIEYESRITTDKLRKDASDTDAIARKAGKDIGDHMEHGSGRAGEALKKFGKVAALALAATGAAVAAFGVSSVKAFVESQNAIAQTEAVLKSTKGVAGVTSEAITDLANSLQRQTRYSDENIRSAENMLLTFTNIGQKTFPGATQAVLDMATAMGTDLQSTAIQVGKALQDPVLGATALQRVGVRLTDSQKDLIKKLVETGDAAGAQAVILKELQTEFGGSAKAAGETFAGRLDILKNQLGEVQEAIGQIIVVAIGPMVSKFMEWFDAAGGVEGIMDKLKGIVNSILPTIKNLWSGVTDVASQVGDYLVPKLKALFNSIGGLIPSLKEFAQGTLVPLAKIVGVTLVVAWGAVIDVVNGVVTALRPLVDWLNRNRGAVTGLAVAIGILYTALRIRSGLLALQGALVTLRMGFVASTVATLGLRGAMGALLASLGPVGWAITAVTVVGGLLAAVFNRGSSAADKQKEAQSRLKESTDALRDAKDRLIGSELSVESATLRVERAQITAKEAVDKYGAESLEAREASLELKRAEEDLRLAHDEATNATNNHLEAEKNYAANGGLILSADQKAAAISRLIDQLGRPVSGGSVTPSFISPRFPGNAKGTDSWRGGLSWVGEQGPELVNLPRGSQVIPNHDIDEVAGGTSIQNNIENIYISKEVDGDNLIRRLTKEQEIIGKGLVPQTAYS